MGSIEIKQVSFTYADEVREERTGVRQEALKSIDLVIPEGQFLCLIGHSGCGKTTLLRLLAGLDKPTAGEILIDGKQVEGAGLDRAVVFQNYSLFPWMKVQKNVEFGISQANKEFARGMDSDRVSAIAADYLERVGMADAAQKYPFQLSGGMRQRVAIARALAMDAEILLFDEPFGALDVKTRCSLQKLVDALWRNGEERKTVFFITHDISEAILLADRVVFMRHGEVLVDRMVDIDRPRSSAVLAQDPRALDLKDELTRLFYLDPEWDVEDEASVQ